MLNLFKTKTHPVPSCFGWMNSPETVAVNGCNDCPYGKPCGDYSLKQLKFVSLENKVKLFMDSVKREV